MDNKGDKVSNEKCEFIKNISATIVLSACVIAILVISILFGFSRCIDQSSISQDYKVNLIVDSLGTLSKESRVTADSILTAIQCQQHLLDDKYKYFLEQKETAQDFITLGGLFVTIALSLFGFFGYRSIESIKENAKRIAETASRETTESILRKDSKSYLEDNASKIINNRIDKLYKEEFSNVLIQKLKDDITKDVSADKQFVSENADLIKARMKDIDNIQNQLNLINDKIKKGEVDPNEAQENNAEPIKGEKEFAAEKVFEDLESE